MFDFDSIYCSNLLCEVTVNGYTSVYQRGQEQEENNVRIVTRLYRMVALYCLYPLYKLFKKYMEANYKYALHRGV